MKKTKNPSNLTYEYIPAREKALDKAINLIKKCPLKGTAIKIELEAFLGRITENRHVCECQEGECPCFCEGLDPKCPQCEGRGYFTCPACHGTGVLVSGSKDITTEQCQAFILDNVSKKAKDHLIFCKTYHDGTVDTEFTFTLPIKYARDAVEFLKAFVKLAEFIGNGIQTHGAGMHIAILNDPKGAYGSRSHNKLNPRHTRNFISGMTHLLPALYFLASPDYNSRKMGYRNPKITLDSKYAAISGAHSVWEFRVFETCYKRPEAILDDICVIANCLKFYSYHPLKYKFFGKIGPVTFNDMTLGLNRLFCEEKNYRALMAGIKLLRPSYKSIAELREERSFTLTLAKIKNKDLLKEEMYNKEYSHERKSVLQLKKEYSEEYKENSKDNNFKKRYSTMSKYLTEMLPGYHLLKSSKSEYIDYKKKLKAEEYENITINI